MSFWTETRLTVGWMISRLGWALVSLGSRMHRGKLR
jgi:hypothetical protein